jgi:hypothetical protein
MLDAPELDTFYPADIVKITFPSLLVLSRNNERSVAINPFGKN